MTSEETQRSRFPQKKGLRQTRRLALLVACDSDSAQYSCEHTLSIASRLEKQSEEGPAQRLVAFLHCKTAEAPLVHVAGKGVPVAEGYGGDAEASLLDAFPVRSPSHIYDMSAAGARFSLDS